MQACSALQSPAIRFFDLGCNVRSTFKDMQLHHCNIQQDISSLELLQLHPHGSLIFMSVASLYNHCFKTQSSGILFFERWFKNFMLMQISMQFYGRSSFEAILGIITTEIEISYFFERELWWKKIKDFWINLSICTISVRVHEKQANNLLTLNYGELWSSGLWRYTIYICMIITLIHIWS